MLAYGACNSLAGVVGVRTARHLPNRSISNAYNATFNLLLINNYLDPVLTMLSLFLFTFLKALYHIFLPISMGRVLVPFLYQILIAKEMNQTFSVVLTD